MRWLKRDFILLLGVVGASLTVLAQLTQVVDYVPAIKALLEAWTALLDRIWKPPFGAMGIKLHPHHQGALSAAIFMTMIGVGARVSARLGGGPLEPIRLGRWLDDMTWPSLIVFAGLCIAFLIGQEPDPSRAPPLVIFGSPKLGQYSFALIVTAGYIAGDFLGHHVFHHRLFRVAGLVAVTLAVNYCLVWLCTRGVCPDYFFSL